MPDFLVRREPAPEMRTSHGAGFEVVAVWKFGEDTFVGTLDAGRVDDVGEADCWCFPLVHIDWGMKEVDFANFKDSPIEQFCSASAQSILPSDIVTLRST